MKMKFLVFLTLFLQLVNSYSQDIEKNIQKYLPNFVKINSDNSFYISKTLISNKEYICYLAYLKNKAYLFGDEAYLKAIPDTTGYKNYLFNPNYQNFPVLGVSKLQAHNFCKWYNNRLNEYILIKAGFLDLDPMGNFTVNSFIKSQFEGHIKEMPAKPGPEERQVIWADKYLTPTLRLPKDEEIKLLFKNYEFTYSKNCKSPFGKKHLINYFFEHNVRKDYSGTQFYSIYPEASNLEESYKDKIFPVCSKNPEINEITMNYTGKSVVKADFYFNNDTNNYMVLKDNEEGNPVLIYDNPDYFNFKTTGKSTELGFRISLYAPKYSKNQIYTSLNKALKYPEDVKVLMLFKSQKNLKEVDFSVFKNLTHIYFGPQQTKSLPKGIEKLENLVFIDLSYSNILVPDNLTSNKTIRLVK